jgi:hypothetical protein
MSRAVAVSVSATQVRTGEVCRAGQQATGGR